LYHYNSFTLDRRKPSQTSLVTAGGLLGGKEGDCIGVLLADPTEALRGLKGAIGAYLQLC